MSQQLDTRKPGLATPKVAANLTFLKAAKKLTRLGFYVFPLIPNSKLPSIKDFENKATRDPKKLREWWGNGQLNNIGVSTSIFQDDQKIVVIDVDNKDLNKGNEEIAKFKSTDLPIPDTLSQRTPTGGRHLIYITTVDAPNTVKKLAKHIDTRGKGGYIVGAGSFIDNKEYTISVEKIADVPSWIMERLGESKVREVAPPVEVNEDAATKRATDYLSTVAVAVAGEGGDQHTFNVACELKDFGVDEFTCYDLMSEWNEKCDPPWEAEELAQKVTNAYSYSKSRQGSKSAEADFEVVEVAETKKPKPKKTTAAKTPKPEKPPIETPESKEKTATGVLKFNQDYAFVMIGGAHLILWETTDSHGQNKIEFLKELTFHRKHASETVMYGNGKVQPLTEVWMKDPLRRSYSGVCFAPEGAVNASWFNLWKGFAVEPLVGEPTPKAQKSLDDFLEHALENVCGGDYELYDWLICYFAQLFQHPGAKPPVALVFKGKKGVGKNALVDRVGRLLGLHYMVTSKKRYLTSQFNGHFERCLLFVLDEAFWSGDKQAEGVLKDLITGNKHEIEKKGIETYPVNNCTRVAILGNEEWLIPATEDERRYAVFNVGDGRFQDTKFFEDMRVGMEQHGGDSLLLKYLLDYKVSANINIAPKTEALFDQKIESLDPLYQWWYECLNERKIIESDIHEVWPLMIVKDVLRKSFKNYLRHRQINSRVKTDTAFTKNLMLCVRVQIGRYKPDSKGFRANAFYIPEIDKCREQWDLFIGHETKWN